MPSPLTKGQLDNTIPDISYKPAGKIKGPIHGGILEVMQYGFILTFGSNDAALLRFYNGNNIEPKQLRERLGGKIWVLDERY